MVTVARVASHAPDGCDRFRVELPTDLSTVGHVVEAVVACCTTAAAVSTRTQFRLCTIVAEAVSNAMVNGNCSDPSRLVVVEIECDAECITIAVSDEGEGFDHRAVLDPTHETTLAATRGRGLFMIRSLADHVAFNDRGNTIWMTLPRC